MISTVHDESRTPAASTLRSTNFALYSGQIRTSQCYWTPGAAPRGWRIKRRRSRHPRSSRPTRNSTKLGRIQSGPRSSRQGGRHSQMIRCRGQRRIRRGSRREHARGPGRHTNVVRGRRRARKVRRWPCGHDRSREPHRYAGPSSIGVGSAVPNASAGVAHPSTRRGRWLTSAATELSASWVSVDRSALLCRYWCSSRLVFSWVPCRPAARARIRDAFERRPRCRGDVHERDSAESGRYHTGKVAPHSH